MKLATESNTAILIFANSSEEELRSKAISESGQFFELLTEQTLATVKKTELPYFLITEKQQIGNSFGERFANALQYVFDAGFENIISIGNDTPHLKASHIKKAAVQLASGKSVLGPSADGGFYLMGLSKVRFKVSEFERLAWRTSHLFKEISALLEQDGEPSFRLQPLFDLDDGKDLELFFKRFKNMPERLRAIIQKILAKAVKPVTFHSIFFADSFVKTCYNKGSPVQ